jgi:hypothetical protein
MKFCPGSKNSIIGKTLRKPEDMTELSTNYVTFNWHVLASKLEDWHVLASKLEDWHLLATFS